MKKIYVGNLSFQATEQELETLFSEYGPVSSVAIIRDRETGRSRGFGFVEMQNDADAQTAIDNLNGKEFSSRALTVNEARERERRPAGGGGGGGGRGGYRGGGGGGGRRM